MNITIASNYKELNDSQRVRLMKAVNSRLRGKLLILYTFIVLALPNRWNFRQVWRVTRVLRNVKINDLRPFVEWVFDLDELYQFPKFVRVRFRKFYGPADKLANLTMEEFSFADLFFYEWTQNRDDNDALNRLMTVLYRPKAKHPAPEDVREPFEKSLLPERAKYIQRLNRDVKLAVAMAFAGSRQYIEKQFPVIFPKRKKTDDAFEKKNTYRPFTEVIRALALDEVQAFGDYYKTSQANVYDFMAILQDKIKHQRELEKKYGTK